MPEWPLPTAVVAHDAGAANLIIAWLQAWKWPVRPCMEGPARQLWAQAFPDRPPCTTLADALDGAASVLSGTGWASRLEHDARRLGRERGLRVAAVLDHWVNYPQRFERDGQTIWPDEFWVADDWARNIAEEVLPAMPVRVHDNLYLKAQVARIAPPPQRSTVLYVLEPVRHDWGRGEPGEFQALDYALPRLDALFPQGIAKILLRPHPSEPADKYLRYLHVDPRITLDPKGDMSQAISQADVVIGVESFALTLALAAGRPVYSSLPPWAPGLRLPQGGIQQIRRLCPT